MSETKTFPIQSDPIPTFGDETPRVRSIPWSAAERAYVTYHRLWRGQSLERLAERGGFGVDEFGCLWNGHDPGRHHPGDREGQIACIAMAFAGLHDVPSGEGETLQQALSSRAERLVATATECRELAGDAKDVEKAARFTAFADCKLMFARELRQIVAAHPSPVGPDLTDTLLIYGSHLGDCARLEPDIEGDQKRCDCGWDGLGADLNQRRQSSQLAAPVGPLREAAQALGQIIDRAEESCRATPPAMWLLSDDDELVVTVGQLRALRRALEGETS